MVPQNQIHKSQKIPLRPCGLVHGEGSDFLPRTLFTESTIFKNILCVERDSKSSWTPVETQLNNNIFSSAQNPNRILISQFSYIK